jgi:hypothetical protein
MRGKFDQDCAAFLEIIRLLDVIEQDIDPYSVPETANLAGMSILIRGVGCFDSIIKDVLLPIKLSNKLNATTVQALKHLLKTSKSGDFNMFKQGKMKQNDFHKILSVFSEDCTSSFPGTRAIAFKKYFTGYRSARYKEICTIRDHYAHDTTIFKSIPFHQVKQDIGLLEDILLTFYTCLFIPKKRLNQLS